MKEFTNLAGYGVGLADLVSPIASSYWDDRQLGQDNGPSDGRSHLFRTLHTKTYMSVVISDRNECLLNEKEKI